MAWPWWFLEIHQVQKEGRWMLTAKKQGEPLKGECFSASFNSPEIASKAFNDFNDKFSSKKFVAKQDALKAAEGFVAEYTFVGLEPVKGKFK